MQKQSDADLHLKQLLPGYLYKYRADRVWVIQYHNGVSNWEHGTMRFELCAEGVTSVKDQYVNFCLTWMNMPYLLKTDESLHGMFVGDLDEIASVDPWLAAIFKRNGVKYLACILIKDSHEKPLGVYGATYAEAPSVGFVEKIKRYMSEDKIEIRTLLKVTDNQ